ncbi:glycosyltransferase family 4 protein [Methyloterricola oryzae]|uniref:glycosyltransferase family 4 protein n=1 Tax=Methyloterricola oryzae TaxID=1495050 RepID=UPI0005EB52A0|nr:glycosyltransferase family 4 protein [Methyloterricola oryzae]
MKDNTASAELGKHAQASRPAPRSYPVNLVSLRMAHHASASGYDRLSGYLGAQVIHAPQHLSVMQRIIGKLCKPIIRRSGLAWYHRASFVTELSVARRWISTKGQVFHFLYGENQFRFAGLLRKLHAGNILVATYHTPEQRFREVVTDAGFLSNLDAVIVMSDVQKDFLARHMPMELIHFVPHGIDTDFFTPDPTVKRGEDGAFRCIAVGSHLRDHATLAAAARLIGDTAPEVRFDIVTRPELFRHYSQLPNVDLHSSVTDSALVSMYQRSDLMVLPLTDATANNSILEAMACGVPIVSTELAGVRDYVDAACAVLVPTRDPERLARAILDLRGDDGQRQAMRVASRLRAEAFAWTRIAERTLEVYDSAWALRGCGSE